MIYHLILHLLTLVTMMYKDSLSILVLGFLKIRLLYTIIVIVILILHIIVDRNQFLHFCILNSELIHEILSSYLL